MDKREYSKHITSLANRMDYIADVFEMMDEKGLRTKDIDYEGVIYAITQMKLSIYELGYDKGIKLFQDTGVFKFLT